MENMKSLKDKITLVILGRSGSGKGTQARFLLQRFGRKNSHHMETGRFLRELLKKNNHTSRIVRRWMEQGRLFPSWLPVYTWLKELIEKGASEKNLVFDGAPRRIWEAELLDEVMQCYNRPLPICIYIDLSIKEATARLFKRGRADDVPSSIRNRLSFFEKDVLPVMKYYQKRKRLLKVDGNFLENKVRQDIDRVLVKRLGKFWAK